MPPQSQMKGLQESFRWLASALKVGYLQTDTRSHPRNVQGQAAVERPGQQNEQRSNSENRWSEMCGPNLQLNPLWRKKCSSFSFLSSSVQ